tara:strand:- start:137 stop:376 length:240 start_codon:yes stop_codon:yes gene_type:complete
MIRYLVLHIGGFKALTASLEDAEEKRIVVHTEISQRLSTDSSGVSITKAISESKSLMVTGTKTVAIRQNNPETIKLITQ